MAEKKVLPAKKSYPVPMQYEEYREPGDIVFDMSRLEKYGKVRCDEFFSRVVAT